MGEAVFKPNALKTPIGEMGAWFFWTRIDAAGLDSETEAALQAGSPTESQLARVRFAAEAAKNRLICAEPYVPYVRQS